jgi:soluble cytochrome b562
MSKEKNLLKKEFETISNFQNQNSKNLNQLGILEFQIQKISQEKLNITTTIEQTEKDFQAELKKLEEKYGNINLDLSTGKFTEVKETLKSV